MTAKVGTIGFINSAVTWGGGEKWHLEMAGLLHRDGHPVVVFAHPEGEFGKRARQKGIPTEDIPIKNLSFLNPSLMSRLKGLIKDHQVHTLILNQSRDLKAGGPAARKSGVERIIYRRGSATPIRDSRLNRRLFRNNVDDVLVNSQATADMVLKNNPELFPKEKITVIPNGIEPEKFLTPPEKLYYEKKDDEIVMVSLGRLEFEKNHAFLVEVANELKFRDLKFRIIIGGEGRERKRIDARRVELNLEEEVIMAGFIVDPVPFLHSGDIFLMPSLWEGFGYVLAEAGACGLPTVGFREGSIPEVVKEGETGYLTKTGDSQQFISRILQLSEDRILREKMGNAARERIMTNYSMEIVNRRMREYLGLIEPEN